MSAIVEHSDCRAYLATLATNSIDACTTDPPYELNFMGRGWDRSGIANQVELWREVYRVLKPGGHVVAFGGTRTYHRMVCAIEDAGFEIRDTLQWLYGSGFPKSHDVSKALDKAAGAERPVVGIDTRNLTSGTGIGSLQKAWKDNGGRQYTAGLSHDNHVAESGGIPITAPATDLAARWAGWGTALKPAHEPIVLARKPLAGTVAANVAQWGTGGINVEACRVATTLADAQAMARCNTPQSGQHKPHDSGYNGAWNNAPDLDTTAGRWPPNLLLSHSPSCNGHCAPDCAVAALDRQSGAHTGGHSGSRNGYALKGHVKVINSRSTQSDIADGYGDTGGASRFYPILNYDPVYDDPFLYCAKASKKERGAANHHPTVKPVALCRWLVRLVTPLGGTALDPFAGSGSFGVACVLEGRHYKGCDQDAEYVEIANRRIAATQPALIGV